MAPFAVISVGVTYAFVALVGNNELKLGGPFNPFTTLNLVRFGVATTRATAETVIALAVATAALAFGANRFRARPHHLLGRITLIGCTLPLLASNLVRWHGAEQTTSTVDYRDAQRIAEHLEHAGIEHVSFDESIWVGDRLFLEFWVPDLNSDRVDLPLELRCESASALVTHQTAAHPEFVAGRLAIVRCSEPGAVLTVEPAGGR